MSKDDKKGKGKKDKDSEALLSADTFVKRRFNEELPPIFLFHNYTYAEEVADAANKLSVLEGLDEKEVERLRIVALFYPLGFIGGESGAWQRSGEEFMKWASVEGYSTKGADEWIADSRNATEESELPVRILHDAAWSWLGRKRYERRYDLLQLEREAREGKVGDPVAFGKEMQQKLLHFKYLTISGREKFDQRRYKNATDQHSNNYGITQDEMKARAAVSIRCTGLPSATTSH